MATPVLSTTVNKQTPYLPGETITGNWTVDADDSTEVTFTGHDSQGNTATGSLVITRQGTFIMTEVVWERTGEALTFNNTNHTFTGTVPTA